jgi:serine/threonine-protein kinase RsbW
VLLPWTGEGFFGLAYAAVASSVWFGGTGPALLSMALLATGARLVLMPPLFSWAGSDGPAEVRWAVFVPVSLLIVVLGHGMWRARRRAERAQRQAERAARRASMLAEMGTALDNATSLEAAAQTLADGVVAGLADVAVVELAGDNGRPGPTAMAHRDAVAEAALRAAPGPVRREQLSALGVRSFTVPLTAQGKRVGVLLVGQRASGPAVVDIDRVFARDLAMRAGLALANIRLREQEHAVAHELQRSLLPRQLPEPAGVTVGARYLPAQAELMVGGDWYDVLELPGGQLGLVVGDVAGHGLAAAASMGQLRSGLAGLALTSDEPAVLLEGAQRFSERLGTSLFATLALASLDPADGSFSYACAGHPPPLVISAAGVATFLWGGRSTPIGFRSPRPREQAAHRLGCGDTLVFYTDGLVETRHEYIAHGFDRLADHAAALAGWPVDELCRELTTRMTGDRISRDDIAVLAVRLTDPAGTAAGTAGTAAGTAGTVRTVDGG